MRFYAVLISAALLLVGCNKNLPVYAEHAEAASMACAIEIGLYCIDEGGTVYRSPVRLPAEEDMAQTVAERFLLENESLLSPDTEISVSIDEKIATANIVGLPRLQTKEFEAAFLSALVLSLTELSGIERVGFLFDGESLAALPAGTPCYGYFGAADFPAFKIS